MWDKEAGLFEADFIYHYYFIYYELFEADFEDDLFS